MLENHYQYLLIGGGLTSGSAAEAIRARDQAGSILLVGQEVNRPYHRPRLNTHYLRGEQRRLDIIVEPPGWFAEKRVELTTGRRAAHLDTNRRMVALDSGEEISFEKLLIATGSSARTLSIPGAQLANVFTLRTIDDADRLHNAIEKAKAEGYRHATSSPLSTGRGIAAVVGSGALGVELAVTLTQLGLKVELILGSAHPWRKFAGESTGSVIAHLLQVNGVQVYPGHRPVSFEGDGRVQRVVLTDGTTLSCDFVITAIGVKPNIELLRGTPITAEKAILVNEHCQTNHPGIYAAGDCAAIFDPLFGKHRLIDHWENARLTGTIAGDHMAGGDAKYNAVNHFRSEVFGVPVSCWGEARLIDRRHIRGNVNVDSPRFVEIGVGSDGRIVQVLAVGYDHNLDTLAELVRQRVNVAGREEVLKDHSRNIEEFLG